LTAHGQLPVYTLKLGSTFTSRVPIVAQLTQFLATERSPLVPLYPSRLPQRRHAPRHWLYHILHAQHLDRHNECYTRRANPGRRPVFS
jgi:hypothetical protein